MSKNILFVLEGHHDARFLMKLLSVFGWTETYTIYEYRTNVHKLLDFMMPDGRLDEDLDLLMCLKESSANREQTEILNHKFTDIYLVFDMDPQDPKFSPGKMEEALRFFDDSSGNGRMYINYPMLESYRHVPDPYSTGYLSLSVSGEEIRRYKEVSGKKGSIDLSDISKINGELMERILILNLMKANVVMNDDGSFPDYDLYMGLDGCDLFIKQAGMLSDENRLMVLNTSVFIVVDYSPKKMLEGLGVKAAYLYRGSDIPS